MKALEQSLADIESCVKSREKAKVTYKMIQDYIEEKYGFIRKDPKNKLINRTTK